MTESVTVTRTIAATPDALWDLVSDLPNMGKWSPENTGGTWKGGATGPTVGAKFEGTNANENKHWKTMSTIVEADKPGTIAWEVTAGPAKIARWQYKFDAVDGGTLVTETWTERRNAFAKWVGKLASKVDDRAAHNRTGMEETLAKLAAAAEGGA